MFHLHKEHWKRNGLEALKKKQAGVWNVQTGDNIIAYVTKSGSDKSAEVHCQLLRGWQVQVMWLKASTFAEIQVGGHPPYSPDPSPCDYAIFGPLKKALRGKRFTSNNDVKPMCGTSSQRSPRNFTRQPFTTLCCSGTNASTTRANTSDIQVLVSVPRPPAYFSFLMSLINIIIEIYITSELIWIYRWNQLLQRVKTRKFLTLCSINLNIAFISDKGNVQPVFNLKPCVMKHLWYDMLTAHKFFLLSLPNHILVSCRSGP